jgi:hypothetical protein
MTIKVLVIGWERPVLFPAILRLTSNYGWEPCYWIGDPIYEKEIKEYFPDCYFHSAYDAIKGMPQPALQRLSSHTLSDEFRRQQCGFELTAIKMMDRVDPWNSFISRERASLFRGASRYWTGVLDMLKPDLVLFHSTPHVVCDYVLYGVAQAQGVGILFFRRTNIPGYIYPVSRIEDPSPIIARYQHLLSDNIEEHINLPSALEEHIRKLSNPQSTGMISHIKNPPAWRAALNLLKKIPNTERYPDYSAYILRVLKGDASYYKQGFRPIEKSRMGPLEYRLYRLSARLKRGRLWRDYHRRARTPDLNAPFVFFPLHYQPERSTLPEGGAFADQRDVIDVISSSLPDGWYLYVKEHPATFSSNRRGDISRDTRYYDDLESYANVRLMPVTCDSSRLIDAAKAVATSTGTAGWEAIIRGTPALVFGDAWYLGCEGAFYVPSSSLCKQAMETIRGGYHVDRRKVRLWLRAMDESCIKAYLFLINKPIDSWSEEENTDNLANAIVEAWASLQKQQSIT